MAQIVKDKTLTDSLSIKVYFFGAKRRSPSPEGAGGWDKQKELARIRQATVRKKQASLPAFFVPAGGKISEPFVRDLGLIVKLDFRIV